MFVEPEIISVEAVLKLKGLHLPNYQRPYKWGIKNVYTLLDDIDLALLQSDKYANYKYRIGTVILHNDKEENLFNIVDGQQRIITLSLIGKALNMKSSRLKILNAKITSKITEDNIQRNFIAIKRYFAEKSLQERQRYIDAMAKTLEVVVVSTNHLAEAFQLFDSQNTRGKALDPHDLLKAFHLRQMRDHPYEMKNAVEKWEETNPNEIRILFRDYLFPIRHWLEREKGHQFSSADIDDFKGVSFDLRYYYAMRAVKGMPIFQIDQPFVSGENFFQYVDHYLNMLSNVKTVVSNKEMGLFLEGSGVGFSYAKQLFYCAVLFYNDRFRSFDSKMIKKLYAWSFMVRLQMQKLGFNSIKNYAIGQKVGDRETIPMFYLIQKCMKESDVLKITIPMVTDNEIRFTPQNQDKDLILEIMHQIFGLSEVPRYEDQ